MDLIECLNVSLFVHIKPLCDIDSYSLYLLILIILILTNSFSNFVQCCLKLLQIIELDDESRQKLPYFRCECLIKHRLNVCLGLLIANSLKPSILLVVLKHDHVILEECRLLNNFLDIPTLRLVQGSDVHDLFDLLLVCSPPLLYLCHFPLGILALFPQSLNLDCIYIYLLISCS